MEGILCDDREVSQSRNPFNWKKDVGRPAGGHPEISLVRRGFIKMPVQFPGYIGNKDDGTTAVMVSLAVTV